MNKQTLKGILDPYDYCETDCISHSQVLYRILGDSGITPIAWYGILVWDGVRTLSDHAWLTVGDYTIDYRVRMWYRDIKPVAEIPHGVFLPSEYPCIHWKGNRCPGSRIDDTVFKILLMRW
jgi:hypothetical protein